MIKAIYVLREDGDYDFVAAFDIERIETMVDGSDMESFINDHVFVLENEGEEVIVVEFSGTSEIVDVLCRGLKNDERNPLSRYKG